MKKIFFTLFISFSIISSIMFSDYVINKNFKVVKTSTVTTENVVKYIKADGTVNECNKREINIEIPFVTEEIYIEVGDKISKGQKLLKFDKESMVNRIHLDNTYKNTSAKENILAKINNYSSFVTSPINGEVTKINTNVGSKIDVNHPVVIVSDLDNLIIKAYVSENIISHIYPGQKALISGESLTEPINGYVHKIEPVAEKKKENLYQSFVSVEVKAEKYDNMKPGSSVTVEFEKENKKSAMLIPFDSVMFDESTPYVFVNRLGYAVKRYVNLGEEYETEVEILDGLNANENIILNPKVEKLCEGDRLSIID